MDRHHLRITSIPVGEPEAPIISVPTMKKFLRVITGSDEDELVEMLIAAATEKAEAQTWRSLAKRNYVQYMSGFPRRHLHDHYISPLSHRVYVRREQSDPQAIKLMWPPLNSVDHLIYIDLNGQEQTLLPGQDFQVDPASEPGEIAPLAGNIWPYTKWGAHNSVRVYYTAGYEVEAADRSGQDFGSVSEPETASDASGAPNPPAQVTSYNLMRTVPNGLALAIMQLVVHWYQNRDPVIAGAGSGGKFLPLPAHFEETFLTYRCWDFNPNG